MSRVATYSRVTQTNMQTLIALTKLRSWGEYVRRNSVTQIAVSHMSYDIFVMFLTITKYEKRNRQFNFRKRKELALDNGMTAGDLAVL